MLLAPLLWLALADVPNLEGKFCLSLAGEFTDIYFHSFKEDRAGGRLELGWFPANWCRLGIEGAYVHAEREYYPPFGGELETVQEEFRVGPQVAFYWPTDFWIRPFVDASIGWARGRFVQAQTAELDLDSTSWGEIEIEDETKDDAFYWRAGLGVSVFPTNWASVDLEVGFGQVVWGPRAGGPEDRLGVGVGISLYF